MRTLLIIDAPQSIKPLLSQDDPFDTCILRRQTDTESEVNFAIRRFASFHRIVKSPAAEVELSDAAFLGQNHAFARHGEKNGANWPLRSRKYTE
jgi:hypothetical protein